MKRLLLTLILSIISISPVFAADASGKLNCAVIGVKSGEGVNAGEGDIIADRLRLELFNTGRANLLERDQMQDILKEQGFQQSGACSDEACMVEIGKVLGVELLVAGSIGKLGKMYLLNFRTIDVKTAKVGAVVSRDISGGIEDVVWYLPSIAQELLGGKAGAQTVPPPAKVEETPPPVAAEPVPAPKEEPVALPPPAPVVDNSLSDEPDVSSRNKNRGGFRFGFSLLMPGSLEMTRDSGFVTNDPLEEAAHIMKTERSTFINPFFRGVIKAGPVLAIDVGGGYMRYRARYWHDTQNYDQLSYNIPSFGVGVNFTKRFAPVKINVGPMVDLGIAILNYSEHRLPATDSVSWTRGKFFVSPAIRAGVELMAGTKVGFNIDAIGRFMSLSVDRYGTISDILYEQETYKLSGMMFGLSAGINLYK